MQKQAQHPSTILSVAGMIPAFREAHTSNTENQLFINHTIVPEKTGSACSTSMHEATTLAYVLEVDSDRMAHNLEIPAKIARLARPGGKRRRDMSSATVTASMNRSAQK